MHVMYMCSTKYKISKNRLHIVRGLRISVMLAGSHRPHPTPVVVATSQSYWCFVGSCGLGSSSNVPLNPMRRLNAAAIFRKLRGRSKRNDEHLQHGCPCCMHTHTHTCAHTDIHTHSHRHMNRHPKIPTHAPGQVVQLQGHVCVDEGLIPLTPSPEYVVLTTLMVSLTHSMQQHRTL